MVIHAISGPLRAPIERRDRVGTAKVLCAGKNTTSQINRRNESGLSWLGLRGWHGRANTRVGKANGSGRSLPSGRPKTGSGGPARRQALRAHLGPSRLGTPRKSAPLPTLRSARYDSDFEIALRTASSGDHAAIRTRNSLASGLSANRQKRY